MTLDELSLSEAAARAEDDAAVAAEEVPPRRRFNRAAAIGGTVGALVFFWMVTTGTFDPLRWQMIGDYYDEQAHSFLRGELAIDEEVLGIEAFAGRGGRTYMYQGPVPALLRVPVVALAGHRLDGRLTQLSMTAAAIVLLVFATRLHWAVRELIRGPTAVGRGEAALVGVLSFVLVGGSAFVYLASRAWVYHEALAWGVALALASIERLVELVRRPRAGTLVWCSVLVTATLLTRASIGLGPVTGLALLAAGSVLAAVAVRRGRRWPVVAWLAPGTQDASRRPHPAVFVAASLLPLAAYAAVNQAKFGQWFSIPFWGQRFTIVDPGRQAMLAANDGTLFGFQFVPTTLLNYLRPDGLRLTATFPFVGFPPFPGRVFGHVVFDLIDRTASVPIAQAFFAALAVVGVAHVFRPSCWSDSGRASLRVPVLAAAAAAAALFPFGYVANRYGGDFLPFLVLAGVAGLQVVLVVAARLRPRWWRVAGAGLFLVLAAWTTWVNLALGLLYQRQWSSHVAPSVLAGFLGFQDDVDRWLGGDGLRPIVRIGLDDPLPDGVGRPGALVVAGDCDALYLSDGMSVNNLKVTPWNGVERSVDGGHRRFEITVPRAEPGTIVPIFTGGTTTEAFGLLLEYQEHDRVRFVYRAHVGDGRTERDFPVEFDRRYQLDVVADRRVNRMSVRIGDATRVETFFVDTGPWDVGRNRVFTDVEPRYPGDLDPLPVATPLCDRLLAQLDAGR